MRIITGKYKGRHFEIPRSFKARPTTDFAKENIFNVLNGYIDFEDAIALDLFSGTGSITLELLSRGCSQVISVELDRDHHRFIQECLNKLTKVEGQRSKVEGQRSKVKGQRSKVEGQRSKVEGRRSKVKGRRSKVKGQRSKVKGFPSNSPTRSLSKVVLSP